MELQHLGFSFPVPTMADNVLPHLDNLGVGLCSGGVNSRTWYKGI